MPQESTLIIEFTRDIPPDVEEAVTREWTEISGSVEVQHVLMRSALPPSWVAVMAEHKELLAILGPSVALFLSEIIKEAAKDTWRNKAAIARALSSAALWPLWCASNSLWRALEDAPRHPSIVIGLLVAEYTQAKCRLANTGRESLALDLALFVRIAEPLAKALQDIEGSADQGIGDYFIELMDDGTATITWMAKESLETMTRIVGERVI